ncbi:uncharacterized protein LOC125575340 [Brassica napus]|uniref:uncharacterized protein LOC125575340 n=1 Tax=Brassica napus TaxID=3708 RepID=UPI002079C124|nr:uncharacterized protein LOC125575340 [Brassica napus]
MVEWRDQNPPPATMMIISNQVGSQFSWDLVRLQQRTLYNLFLAYSVRPVFSIVLSTSQEWRWKELLQNKRSAPLVVVQGAKLYCKSCNYGSQRLKKFRKHLSSYNHAREEGVTTVYTNVERVTADWGRNYKATPEFATAKIQVWWDMFDCPIPQGYDARQVRPSIEAAFKELGYSGPVSITAYGDHKHTPLQALSSTGVHVAHAVPGVEYKRMAGDVREWHADNPPQTAAIMMVISDNVDIISIGLVKLLQENKYNLFLAYSFRPYQMSYLLTSAEWLWESLLAGPLTKHSLLSESESSVSTAMFHCKLCRFDTISIDNFRAHLLSDEKHAQEVNSDMITEIKPESGEYRRTLNLSYDRQAFHYNSLVKASKKTTLLLQKKEKTTLQQAAQGKTAVYWDYENVPVPYDFPAETFTSTS